MTEQQRMARTPYGETVITVMRCDFCDAEVTREQALRWIHAETDLRVIGEHHPCPERGWDFCSREHAGLYFSGASQP